MRAMKFKCASFNNRKRQLTVVYSSGKKIDIHYGDLGIQSPVSELWLDRETKHHSLGIRLKSGQVDYMPYDQPLWIAKDPEFLLQTHIELWIAKIKARLAEKGISKRYLAEQLHTSDNQIYRLLNPAILNKSLPQLYQMAALLGLEMEIALKAA